MGQNTDTTTAHIWTDTSDIAEEAQELMNGNKSKASIYHQAMEMFIANLQNSGGDPSDA